ncbi:MAG: aromatic acid exporter family protein [Erysipelotrichales bacterium]
MKVVKDILPLRIIKTSIAFLISLLLAPFFYCDSFFASLGSLRSMRESLTLSFQTFIEQIIANGLAFVFAILYASLLGITPISTSLALFTLLIFIKKLNFYDAYMAAAMVLAAIMLLSDDQADLIDSAFVRFFSSIFGMVIAVLVNSIVFKPRKDSDLEEILYRLNEYMHIFMDHDCEEYAYLELKATLDDLHREKSLIKDELRSIILPKAKKQALQEHLIEIEIVEAQAHAVLELPGLADDFRKAIIPVIIKLNYIKHYLNDDEDNEIPAIKKEIKNIYAEHTDDSNFFTHTRFLSDLNVYINLIRDL